MTGIGKALCGLLLAVLLAACEQRETRDVLTQAVTSGDRIPVTVLVKYAFSIKAFEKAAEKNFPGSTSSRWATTPGTGALWSTNGVWSTTTCPISS